MFWVIVHVTAHFNRDAKRDVDGIPATANRSPKTANITLNNLLQKSEINIKSISFGEAQGQNNKKATNKIKYINDLNIKKRKVQMNFPNSLNKNTSQN